MTPKKKSATQVQSDLANLSSTVAAIEGNIGTTLDAALAEGLAGVNEVIAQLQAQVDNIATGEDVDQINESINQVELDIEELLASNNKPLLDPQTKTYEKVSAWS